MDLVKDEHGTLSVRQLNRGNWHDAASQFRDYTYLQNWEYGEALAQRHGANNEAIAVVRGKELLGIASVRVKLIPGLGVGVAYVCGGPITRVDDSDGMERFRECLLALRAHYVEKRGLVLRVLAPLGSIEWNEQATGVFAGVGFLPHRDGRGYRTMVVDTKHTLDEIETRFSANWRSNLRRGQRRGVVVRAGTGAELFAPLCAMYRNLLERKRFEVDLDADFYTDLQSRLPEEEKLTVFLAELNGEPVSAIVASQLGDTCVGLVGATSDLGAKNYASYGVYWSIMRTCQERRLRWFDLAGIDPQGNTGVYNFKKGTGGVELVAAGPFEAAPGPMKHTAVKVAERVYRWMQVKRTEASSK